MVLCLELLFPCFVFGFWGLLIIFFSFFLLRLAGALGLPKGPRTHDDDFQ
jgi:hypothetical protein